MSGALAVLAACAVIGGVVGFVSGFGRLVWRDRREWAAWLREITR